MTRCEFCNGADERDRTVARFTAEAVEHRDLAAYIPPARPDWNRRVAAHEAGHVVVGLGVGRAVLRADVGHAPHVAYGGWPRPTVRGEICCVLAGLAAEMPRWGFWPGLPPGLLESVRHAPAAPTRCDYCDAARLALFDTSGDRDPDPGWLLTRMMRVARRYLETDIARAALESVADALQLQGVLTAAEIEKAAPAAPLAALGAKMLP